MYQDHTEPPPALAPFELTYSPAYRPSGSPINPSASRQELQERRTEQLLALTAEGATDSFERATGYMVTACTRLQEVAAADAAQHRYRVEADWLGGGFGFTKGFPSEQAALNWGQAKARAHADAVICVTARGVPA